MQRGVTVAFVVGLVAIALVLPSGAAGCTESFCFTDEEAGDTETPCTEDAPHAPRYRYLNVSAKAGESTLAASLTFACESDGRRWEWFYGNATYDDSQRRDEVDVWYFYGEKYHGTTCIYSIDINPDRVGFHDAHRAVFGDAQCPYTDQLPSVVSTLP